MTLLVWGLFSLGVVFGLVAYFVILSLFKKVNRDVENDATKRADHGWHLTGIVLLTFLSIFCLWLSIGIFPTWYYSKRVVYYPVSVMQNDSARKMVWKFVNDESKADANDQAKVGKSIDAFSEPFPTILQGPDMSPGTFGDQFGAANALFSGLALAGVILAVLLQTIELKYQRAELANTRKVFTNTYHLQAVQTYLNSTEQQNDKNNMLADLRESIRYIRLYGDIDKYQLIPVNKRATNDLSKLNPIEAINEIIIEGGNEAKERLAEKLSKAVVEIDESNIGNHVLPMISVAVRLLYFECSNIDYNRSATQQVEEKERINGEYRELIKKISKLIDPLHKEDSKS
jgi:hypothetical protein